MKNSEKIGKHGAVIAINESTEISQEPKTEKITKVNGEIMEGEKTSQTFLEFF
jgi:hypothetical protein